MLEVTLVSGTNKEPIELMKLSDDIQNQMRTQLPKLKGYEATVFGIFNRTKSQEVIVFAPMGALNGLQALIGANHSFANVYWRE